MSSATKSCSEAVVPAMLVGVVDINLPKASGVDPLEPEDEAVMEAVLIMGSRPKTSARVMDASLPVKLLRKDRRRTVTGFNSVMVSWDSSSGGCCCSCCCSCGAAGLAATTRMEERGDSFVVGVSPVEAVVSLRSARFLSSVDGGFFRLPVLLGDRPGSRSKTCANAKDSSRVNPSSSLWLLPAREECRLLLLLRRCCFRMLGDGGVCGGGGGGGGGGRPLVAVGG